MLLNQFQYIRSLYVMYIYPFKEPGNLLRFIAAASLPFDCFTKLLKVLNLHMKGLLKTGTKNKKPDDIKAYKLSFVTNLLTSEVEDLLDAIISKEYTIDEAIARADQIKKIHPLQNSFCQETSCDSWAVAEAR